MRTILLPALRHDKSSRGTPRLRRPSGMQHGAQRLAGPTTALDSCSFLLADAGGVLAALRELEVVRTTKGLLSASCRVRHACRGALARSHGLRANMRLKLLGAISSVNQRSGAIAARLKWQEAWRFRGCLVHADRRTFCWPAHCGVSDA